jgi:hypothetical protein
MASPISISQGVRALVAAALLGVWVCRLLPVAAVPVVAVPVVAVPAAAAPDVAPVPAAAVPAAAVPAAAVPAAAVPVAAVPVAAVRAAVLPVMAVLLLTAVPPAEVCELLFPLVPTAEHTLFNSSPKTPLKARHVSSG